MKIPSVHPYIKKSHPARIAQMRAAGSGPWRVPDLCQAYAWPTGLAGGGTIGIVELGGGWTTSDMQAYFQSIGQPVPSIVDVSVDGTQNAPGSSDADGEVALDIQVAAAAYAAATGGKAARIRVYWAQDIASAVRAAAKDGCDVCSISWGADEATWGRAAADDMEQAAAEAVAAGTIVLAASGDNDSSDGGASPANVDAPASCPHVVGCGGTQKTRGNETVWNHEPGNASGEGTGGGYSTIFPMPAWQLSGGAPAGPGRMVPDVAANADPSTGYEVFFGGSAQVVGGTSAVAPLYAGLLAALGQKLGFVAPTLWSRESAFSDVVAGDNGTYQASVGPDPCTGLGAPIGARIAQLLAPSAGGVSPTPPSPTPGPIPVPPAPPPVGVTLTQAIAWATSLLPHQIFVTRRRVATEIEQGLAQSWPPSAAADGVTLDQAIQWAESLLPRALMSVHGAKIYVERGLERNWPSTPSTP